ncbi:regulatory protein RepA [Azospirillaceae bacterium]
MRSYVERLHLLASPYKGKGKLVTAGFGQKPDGSDLKPCIQHFEIGDVEGMVSHITALSAEPHRNVYMPLAVFRHDLPAGKKGSESDIVAVLGMVADFDDARAAAYNDRLPLPPDMVLETSAGRYQAFFLFDKPLAPEEAKRLACSLQAHCACDLGTKDISHVWRIPGTLNWPNAKKLAEGRAPEPQLVSVVVEAGEGEDFNRTDPNRLINVLARDGSVSVSGTEADGEEASVARGPAAGMHAEGVFAPTDGEGGFGEASVNRSALIDRLASSTATSFIAKLLEKPVAEVADRSGHIFRIIGLLKKNGLLKEEIEALIAGSPVGRSKYAGWTSDAIRKDIYRCIDRTDDESSPYSDAALSGLGEPSPSHGKSPLPKSGSGSAISEDLAAPVCNISATPFIYRDPASIPRREYLYGRHLIRKFVSLTVAPGATGKSSLMVADALALSTGRDLLQTTVWDGPHRVWVWNLEDPRDELERRIVAAMIHYQIRPADIGDRLFLDSGRDQGLCIAKQERSGTIIIEPVVDALVAELVARKIDELVVDPFVSSHAVNENDNNAIDAVVKVWGLVAERANCAIELVHHLRKLGDAEATAESARGAVALVAAARSVRVLNRMTKDEADRAGLETHRGYFRAYDDMCNLAPAPDKSEWFHIVSVQLPNGDDVGVVVPWEWPNVLDTVEVADLLAVQKAVDGKGYRASDQANDWVGHAVARVLSLDLDKKSDKKRIKALLKIWIKSGALVVTEALDDTRRKRPVVEVGQWATVGCSTFKSGAEQSGASGVKGDCSTAPPAPPPYREVSSGGGAPRAEKVEGFDGDATTAEQLPDSPNQEADAPSTAFDMSALCLKNFK